MVRAHAAHALRTHFEIIEMSARAAGPRSPAAVPETTCDFYSNNPNNPPEGGGSPTGQVFYAPGSLVFSTAEAARTTSNSPSPPRFWNAISESRRTSRGGGGVINDPPRTCQARYPPRWGRHGPWEIKKTAHEHLLKHRYRTRTRMGLPRFASHKYSSELSQSRVKALKAALLKARSRCRRTTSRSANSNSIPRTPSKPTSMLSENCSREPMRTLVLFQLK